MTGLWTELSSPILILSLIHGEGDFSREKERNRLRGRRRGRKGTREPILTTDATNDDDG